MNEHYKFINVPLPYAYNAMEPYIDAKTMKLHHSRHLQTYINNLNNTLEHYPQFQGWALEDLLFHLASLPKEIRESVKNNGGGVYSHWLYFSNLTDPAHSKPAGALSEAITSTFTSMENFKAQFKKAALSVFGSGYAWLVLDAAEDLKIITTANQDTPLPLGLCPILNIDVWEHAYYLKHYNVRADYIEDWFHVINWENADRYYKHCLSPDK